MSGIKLRKALHSELNESKYLIVICSPESANAFWVNDEVQTFIAQGKGDKIIPFIVSGTAHSPNPKEECFSKALQELSKEEEIRGIDVHRNEGKMHALIDVIATMFDIRFDELWQRHERRRKKIRNITIVFITTLLFLISCIILLKKVCEANPKETQQLKMILNGVNSLIPTFHRDFVYNGIVSGIIRADGEFSQMEQLLFRNVARLEHLRWNASHEMLGYQSYASGDPKCELVEDENDNRHSCNERFKLHNCLISWQELDNETNHKKNAWHPDYKLYDFIVITTTLRLYIKNNF